MNTVVVLRDLQRHLHTAIRDVLLDLDDQQIQARASVIDARPIWEIAVHAQRPILAVVCALAGVERPPRPTMPGKKQELLDIMSGMAEHIDTCMNDAPPQRWLETISLPWGQQTALEAYIECISHGLIHVGQIAGVRAMNGFPTRPEAQ